MATSPRRLTAAPAPMRRSPRDTLRAVMLAALLTACTPAAQRPYVAPTRETVVSTTEDREGPPAAHLIYIENHSTVPVIVFGVSLVDCENVKGMCSQRSTNIRVAPNSRQLAARVEASDPQRGFGYHFGFSWRADSSSLQALNVLAANGEANAQAQIAARNHADSLARAETGPRYNDLSAADFALIGAHARAVRLLPDSLVMAPGQQVSVERIRLLVLDSAGAVLGQTRWVRWQVAQVGALSFVPPATLVARAPGRGMLRFRLADQAQAMLPGVPSEDVELPVIVAYPFDAHAPTFEGIAVDADSKAPLACLRVALEDSVQNAVASGRTDLAGNFSLRAPRPGTYRVRMETSGWAPVAGPLQAAAADQSTARQYAVRFTDKLFSPVTYDPSGAQHPYPVAVTASAFAKPPAAGTVLGKSTKPTVTKGPRAVVQSVSLRGSETLPILNIVGNAPPGTIWIQFVVDAEGRVDAGSIVYPPGTDDRAMGSVNLVLPHVKFSPAKENDQPVCELTRMQVNFSPR